MKIMNWKKLHLGEDMSLEETDKDLYGMDRCVTVSNDRQIKKKPLKYDKQLIQIIFAGKKMYLSNENEELNQLEKNDPLSTL